jgi:hypothetical protein
MDYKDKYLKYKKKYKNLIKYGGQSECTQFKNRPKECINYPMFKDKVNGTKQKCSYKDNGSCYKISYNKHGPIHARIKKKYPEIFNDVPNSVAPDTEVPDSVVPDSEDDDSEAPDSKVPDSVVPDSEDDDSEAPDNRVPDRVVPYSVVPDSEDADSESHDIHNQEHQQKSYLQSEKTKLESELAQIRLNTSKAMREQNRSEIQRLMKLRQPITDKLTKINSQLDKFKKHPREECGNKTCDISDDTLGLEDPITGNCELHDKLIKLSDRLCYNIDGDGGIRTLINSSNDLVRSPVGEDYTLEDYKKIFNDNLETTIKYRSQKYKGLFRTYDNLHMRYTYKMLAKRFLIQCDSRRNHTREELQRIKRLFLHSNRIPPEYFDHVIDMDEIFNLLDKREEYDDYKIKVNEAIEEYRENAREINLEMNHLISSTFPLIYSVINIILSMRDPNYRAPVLTEDILRVLEGMAFIDRNNLQMNMTYILDREPSINKFNYYTTLNLFLIGHDFITSR